MIWSRRSNWSIHCDIADPKRFELVAAKEILAELYRYPDLGGGRSGSTSHCGFQAHGDGIQAIYSIKNVSFIGPVTLTTYFSHI
jgi:hypothetical protein